LLDPLDDPLEAAIPVLECPPFEEPIASWNPKHYPGCHEEYVVDNDDGQLDDQTYNYYWEIPNNNDN
jgi:hypothetical protein